jgi:uncharacterized pyridoxal phosphate-containing UPF0001 family protein
MTIAENLADILTRIALARKAAIKPAAMTRLVAVSKTVPESGIREALAAGQRLYGENRVQEAQAKFPQLKTEFPDLELHLIGPLQTNKVRDAVTLFDCIQTLDRARLADVLAAERDKSGKCPALFLQVNTGEEPQKAGVPPRGLPNLSMGMSGDFELAVKFGATHVRVGTAIFGARTIQEITT